MAARLPKRYEPGELEQTRKHLGKVSDAEARRMAKLLGGEVGVERSSAEIEEKYRKIGELNRRRRDHFSAPSPRRSSAAAPRTHSPVAPGPAGPRKAEGGLGYFERLRMDFVASRPEYRIKTRTSAFAAIFAVFMPVRDFVNHRFITDADDYYFTTVENLVLSVRQLLARYAKSPRTLMKIPYYEEVLTVIRDWDIEGLSKEIARLQTRPRRLLIGECAELCRLLLRPMVRLLDLDANYHIAQALKHVHDVDLASIPKDSSEAPKIKLAYTMGRDMILRVFIDLKQSLYPLLMKLAADRFYAYSDFFVEQRSNVLAFLSLESADLVEPKEREKAAEEQQAGQGSADDVSQPDGPNGETDGEEAAETGEETELEGTVVPGVPDEIGRGLELLDELFPQAGFLQIGEFPDMYPYFQPLLKLPRGTELITQEDPLQQIIIIVACLQEIFYGFRSIRFATMGDDTNGIVQTAQRVESLTGNWHLFLDEIIGKNYLQLLFEYCHQVERGLSNLRSSEYVGRVESELTWIKRRFFLPKLKGRIIKGLHPNVASDLPRLPDTVADMRQLLERVIADVQSDPIESIENPWGDFSFAVEGYLSRRLRLVLSRRENPEPFLSRRVSNVSLVFHTLLILRTLDFLINDERSFYAPAYVEAGQPIYRADPSNDGAPQYTVAVEDTFALIDRSERRRLAESRQAPTSEEPLDKLTKMKTAPAMAKMVRELMREHGEEKSFVLMPVTLRRYSDIAGERGKEGAERWLKKVAVVITSEIRDFEDIPFRVGAGAFIVVMPDTTGDDAVHLADRLAKRFREVENGELPISIGVVESRAEWTFEHLMKTTQGAIREAARLPSPALVTHEPTTDTFVPHS